MNKIKNLAKITRTLMIIHIFKYFKFGGTYYGYE